MRGTILILALVATSGHGTLAKGNDVHTRYQYLSGHGCDDMVEWDFKCTDGRHSGEWTKIGVPSCWELQGFGTYQYGMRFYGKATPEGIADERGLYKTEFSLPENWQGRQIQLVFEATFTDMYATINGRKAGNGLYQGGYTRHTIDVSDRVFFGKKKNRLEVEVAKESANQQVNLAERRADYWNFGGIWRPVFIVSKPARNISRVAINAKADGLFMADVFLNRALAGCSVGVDIVDAKGAKVGSCPAVAVASDQVTVSFSVDQPRAWTAETPILYTAVFTLRDTQGQPLHVERQRFGFRTIEYRHQYAGDQEDGVFVNGHKIKVKGVNRHSFRPESGRTLSKQKNIEDVELIKSMNMNAVRLSHYPADPEFLDACDSLGLYVLCELPGWHRAHETIAGRQIAEEMVVRDVNHPSILFWSNGNEGGFNYELEPVFSRLDPQGRVVLYPWSNCNGFETKHYRSWGETAEFMRHKELFMPTEFLHGLYDGGHGAGLKDYWQLMMSNPRCVGGFLWDLMDQGVVRTDQDGLIDCVGNFGSDGIVGPHMEKEGSFYTIRELWCPIQLTVSEGTMTLYNGYDFTNLADCQMSYRYLVMPDYGKSTEQEAAQGALKLPCVEPGGQTTIVLPVLKARADVLELTVCDPMGETVGAWRIVLPGDKPAKAAAVASQPSLAERETADTLEVTVGNCTYVFSKQSGLLVSVRTGHSTLSFGNGPRFVAAKRSDRSQDGFYNHDDKKAFDKKTQYTEYADEGSFSGFEWNSQRTVLTASYKHGSMEKVAWTFLADGRVELAAKYNFNGVVDLMGIAFDYPEAHVRQKQWVGRGPYRVWQNRMEGPQYGYWQTDYNDPVPGESWEYPEFKGYFADVKWMLLKTDEGQIGISPQQPENYVGIYHPRDGRDHILYDLPATGIALLDVIPAVRNKVNTTDLNGPSAQPKWVTGQHCIGATLTFGQ